MEIIIIAAVAENKVIGKENDLIWHLPKDLKFFKDKTTGHHLVMGRRTFESCGSKPLPNRTNIIVTRQPDYKAEGCLVATSLREAIGMAKDEDQLFIAGGAEIYTQALKEKLVDKMYITHIHHAFDGDTFFPELDLKDWVIRDETFVGKDEKNPYHMTFLTYRRV